MATFAQFSMLHPRTLPLSRQHGQTPCRHMSRRPTTRFQSTSRLTPATVRTALTGRVTLLLPQPLIRRWQRGLVLASRTICVSWASPCSLAPRPMSLPTLAGRASRGPLARTRRSRVIPARHSSTACSQRPTRMATTWAGVRTPLPPWSSTGLPRPPVKVDERVTRTAESSPSTRARTSKPA